MQSVYNLGIPHEVKLAGSDPTMEHHTQTWTSRNGTILPLLGQGKTLGHHWVPKAVNPNQPGQWWLSLRMG